MNTTETSNLVKKLIVTQKLVKLKTKVNDHDHAKLLLFNNLIS